ncbi:MAG TPA: hypothetical protein VL945_01520 [Candidatus Saccharimonadales bacterium]|nr:hypothetical protein [Candidatus Saccharimonadales bacterium]
MGICMNAWSYLKYMDKIRTAIFVAVFGGIIGSLLLPVVAAQSSSLSSTLCGILNGISLIIGVLAIFMFVLGGVLYAFAHFLPAAGNLKGSMQGWGMGVLMGGIIMIILYVLAPYIVGAILKFNVAGSGTVVLNSAGSVNCVSQYPTPTSNPPVPT